MGQIAAGCSPKLRSWRRYARVRDDPLDRSVCGAGGRTLARTSAARATGLGRDTVDGERAW